MPTYTWSRTREQLRDMILRKLGVLGTGQGASAEDAELVYEAMDARLKEMATMHVLWWNVSGAQTQVALTGGVATATISEADYLYPVTFSIVIGLEQKPLDIIDHRAYQAIPDKAQQGEPERVFIDGTTCRFHPVPMAGYDGNLTYQAIASDTESGAAADVPAPAMRAFAALVAGDLVDDFSLPAEKAMRLTAAQSQAKRDLRMVAYQRTDTAVVAPQWF